MSKEITYDKLHAFKYFAGAERYKMEADPRGNCIYNNVMLSWIKILVLKPKCIWLTSPYYDVKKSTFSLLSLSEGTPPDLG